MAFNNLQGFQPNKCPLSLKLTKGVMLCSEIPSKSEKPAQKQILVASTL